MLILKILFVRPIDNLGKLYHYLYNYLVLKLKNVEYSDIPNVNGKLFISNNGKCVFGIKLVFNSSITSNFVGLTKPCTIGIQKGAQLIIGDYSGFSGVSIFCSKYIKIGNHVNFGGNVSVWDTDFHPLCFEDRRSHNINKINSASITIEDDVFIGAYSIILKGVTIGARSIIGAGSVVTKNIPADEIWAGNPAKFIRKNNIIK